MIYQSDFAYYLKKRNQPARQELNKWAFDIARQQPAFQVVPLTQQEILESKIVKKDDPKPLVRPWKEEEKKKAERPIKKVLGKLFNRFCENTTIHGVKYLGMKDQHWSERIIWIILVSAGMSGIAYISNLLQERFSGTPLATVVESTMFPVANIPYPAITLCNFNRVDWAKVEKARERYLPKNASAVIVEQFHTFLKVLNKIEYGSFDEFSGIQDWNITALDHIDLLELYESVTFTCEELFNGATCWWRNKYLNCCDLFHRALSEYGLCFAFNSALNERGHVMLREHPDYPWRTATFADWSGLRMVLHTPNSSIPDTPKREGIILMISNPWDWPSYGYRIPAGSDTGIMIRPTYSYATENVANLEIEQRNCLFDDEKQVDGQPVMQIPMDTGRYTSVNCFTECRQRHMLKYCNCTISFFYPTGSYRKCTMSGVQCLNRFDPILNYMKPPSGNPFFDDDEEGITCTCFQECLRLEYAIEISPNMVTEGSSKQITVDVHFQRGTIVKYRTDVVFGWMDLLVGFGGIAGLFLGVSIMSGMEFLYYVLIGIGFMIHRLNTIVKAKAKIKLAREDERKVQDQRY